LVGVLDSPKSHRLNSSVAEEDKPILLLKEAMPVIKEKIKAGFDTSA
jgi:hypothetical protein